MFDHQHYVPVMRMKPAELRTLRDLVVDRGGVDGQSYRYEDFARRVAR